MVDKVQKEPVSEDILDVSRIDYRLQHKSIEDGIKYHAEEYSFNIESVLYNQLTGEQQKLWRKELERAVISGGYYVFELSRDKRYKENQESVSEDLEKAAKDYVTKEAVKDIGGDWTTVDILNAFNAGAKWQFNQLEKNRLKHCDSITNEQAGVEQGFIDQHLDKHQRMPTFLDAIEYGMRLQKEQMMAKAVDVEVKVDAGGYPYIPQMELYDYDKDEPFAKEGDKYKVVLIK